MNRGTFINRSKAVWEIAEPPPEPQDDGPVALARAVIAAVNRHRLKLIGWTLACMALAALYAQSIPPSYTASAMILLETRQPISSETEGVPSLTLDLHRAEGEIQVITSERLLSTVFESLGLENVPELGGIGAKPAPPSVSDRFFGFLRSLGLAGLLDAVPAVPGSAQQDGEAAPTAAVRQTRAELRRRAFLNFAQRVDVRRIGQSYVAEVSYTSSDPALARRVANAIVSAYLLQSLELKARAVEGGSAFLQGNVNALNRQVDEAAAAMAKGELPAEPMPDADARVLGEVLRPLSPSAPRTKLIIAFGGVFGLMSGFFAIALLHAFDRRIRTKDQLVWASGLPCLTVVPKTRRARRLRMGAKMGSLALSRPREPFAVAIRDLRTLVRLAARAERGEGSFAVAIVAPTPRAGTTLLAHNLAHIIHGHDQKVTLIDANIGRPAADPDSPSQGECAATLADALATATSPETIEFQDVDGIDYLPARSQNAKVNYLADPGAPQMGLLIEQVRARSVVVIDLPPLSASADAKAAAHHADVVVLVADAGRSTGDEVRSAVRALQKVGANLIGVVLNRVS